MRFVQCVLLVIGASSLGLVSCVFLSFCLIAVMSTPSSGKEWGSAIFFVIVAFCGGIVGAIAGFVGAIGWIAERQSGPWKLSTWIGIVLGIACAVVTRFAGLLDFCVLGELVKSWSGLAFLVAAAATLGGFASGIAANGWHSCCADEDCP